MFLAARRRIDEVNRLMSTYLPDSEISRLNRDGSARVSDETLAVLRKADEVSRLSGGAFDVTYAPLRTLWRQRRGGRQAAHGGGDAEGARRRRL